MSHGSTTAEPPRTVTAAAGAHDVAHPVAERVVFGIDFGPASLGAARWTTGHLGPADAALFAHVVTWPDGPVSTEDGGDGAPDMRGLRHALLGGLGGLAASLRLDGARPVVQVGRPSACLAALAASERASLLVLGRRKDAARQRVGEPNVVERVARRAPCDVLVVPEGTAGPIEHVIAAVDVGASAERVVARARTLARTHGAALTLVHVVSPSHGSYDRLLRARRRRPDVAEERAAAGETASRDAAYAWLAWLARDAELPVACRLSVPTGDAGREIVRLAKQGGGSGARLVVLGKRGADEAPDGSLGSVARDVLARSASPVLALDGPSARP
jgi:nucleotide-binding universal stress UspA family protein